MTANTGNLKIGRVVIELRSGNPNAIALEEAIHMARIFGSELEGLFISDAELDTVAELPIARTISMSGRTVVRQVTKDLKREVFLASQSMRRRFDQLAGRARLRHRFTTTQDRPVPAMLSACSCDDRGALLVLSETLGKQHIAEIDELLEKSDNLRGVLMVGPGTERRSGPVILVPGKLNDLPTMIASAEALSAPDRPIIIFLTGDDEEELRQRAANFHKALEPSMRLHILSARIPQDQPDVMTEAIRRLKGGLVIATCGGILAPCRENLVSLATALECPLMITR